MAGQLIKPAMMARFRALDESAMPSTCRVLRRTATTSGGRTEYGDEEQVGSTVNCRLTLAGSPQELEALGRLSEEAVGTVALPIGTECRSKDRIEVTTVLGAATFVEAVEVIGDPTPGSYSTNLTAAVKRED